MNGYAATETNQHQRIQSYYQWQSRIYDLTRWSFLFGRRALLQHLPSDLPGAPNLLEVGCGTGYNLSLLAQRYPKARLLGFDVSADMLAKAAHNTAPWRDRISLLEKPYQFGEVHRNGKMDVILFSYTLTMINPQWQELLFQAHRDLKLGGYIAVVDFHDSRFPGFKQHMSHHHVRMDSHLVPALGKLFLPEKEIIRSAYGGIWQYFLWIGRKG